MQNKLVKSLLLFSMVYAANASAVWVDKSDSWCKSHGFTPVCSVWEKAVVQRPDGASAELAKGTDRQPEVGDIRVTPKADAKTARLPGSCASAIFDRWGKLKNGAKGCEGLHTSVR